MKKSLLFLLIGIFFGYLLSILLNKTHTPLQIPQVEITKSGIQVSSSADDFPYLNLPNGQEYGFYDDESAYRSYPTTNVTIKEYDNKILKLNPPKSLTEILQEESYRDFKKENFETYGAMAASYLPEDYILTKEEFDVDNDGKKEIIVSIGGTGGNHPPLYSQIIKNGQVIFSVSQARSIILPSKTGNGFYVRWNDVDKHLKAFCCPSGFMQTRFDYKDGKFEPVWEQEDVYVKIGSPSKQ